jgi:PPOX class probable F420-dependent enzyme
VIFVPKGTEGGMTTRTNDIVVPATHRDLLEKPVIAHLATARPDGALQSNPVWFEWDGEHIKISQTKARQKMRNVESDPHVALSVTDPDNPYRYLEVRGGVDRIEDDRGNEFIDGLSERYMGQRPYPNHQPGDERVIVYIRPDDTSSMAA